MIRPKEKEHFPIPPPKDTGIERMLIILQRIEKLCRANKPTPISEIEKDSNIPNIRYPIIKKLILQMVDYNWIKRIPKPTTTKRIRKTILSRDDPTHFQITNDGKKVLEHCQWLKDEGHPFGRCYIFKKIGRLGAKELADADQVFESS